MELSTAQRFVLVRTGCSLIALLCGAAIMPSFTRFDILPEYSVEAMCFFACTFVALSIILLIPAVTAVVPIRMQAPDAFYSVFLFAVLLSPIVRTGNLVWESEARLAIVYCGWYVCGRCVFYWMRVREIRQLVAVIAVVAVLYIVATTYRALRGSICLWNPNPSAVCVTLSLLLLGPSFVKRRGLPFVGPVLLIGGLCWIGWTKCRTAWVGCMVPLCLAWLRVCQSAPGNLWLRVRNYAMSAVLMGAMVGLSCIAYQVKPLSVHGRLWWWRVCWQVCCSSSPSWGVGPRALARESAKVQRSLFLSLPHDNDTVRKMVAGCYQCAFNEYLDVFLKWGMIAAIAFISCTCVIAWKACGTYTRQAHNAHHCCPVGRAQQSRWKLFWHPYRGSSSSAFLMGACLATVALVLMRLFYSTHDMIGPSVIWSMCSGIVVSGASSREVLINGRCDTVCMRSKVWPNWVMLATIVVWGVALCSMVEVSRRFLQGCDYSSALRMLQRGHVSGALVGLRRLHAHMSGDVRFLATYGEVLLRNGCHEQAKTLYENLSCLFPSAQVFERLGYCNAVLQDTNSARISLERAVMTYTHSLDAHYQLAVLYSASGDYSNAVKYAQLVVNIPMKKDTPRAREMKVNAQKLLNELGVQCDDPGLVVFDIRDRRTWNEGRW